MKQVNKYARLLEYSKGNGDRHTNMVYLHDASRSVIATNGYRMLAVREIYNEIKVLSRVLDSNCLEYKEGALVVSNDKITPGFSSIIPTNEILAKDYKRVRLEIPSWIKGISKREKKPYVSFMLGDSPSLAITDGSEENYCTVDIQFLKDFTGQEVDIYIKDRRSAIVVVPSNDSFDTAPWFSLVMPVRSRVRGMDYIDSTNDASEKCFLATIN
jgi:hypothetical protein